MRAGQAAERLVDVVEADGLQSRDDLTLRAILRSFRRFALIEVDDVSEHEDGDLLLFETAIAPTGEFEVSLSRQLFLEEDALNSGMVDVSLVARLPGSPELRPLAGAQLWGCGGPPWPGKEFRAAEEFVDEIERSRAFQVVADRPVARAFVDRG